MISFMFSVIMAERIFCPFGRRRNFIDLLFITSFMLSFFLLLKTLSFVHTCIIWLVLLLPVWQPLIQNKFYENCLKQNKSCLTTLEASHFAWGVLEPPNYERAILVCSTALLLSDTDILHYLLLGYAILASSNTKQIFMKTESFMFNNSWS